jgi:hypothetical protein
MDSYQEILSNKRQLMVVAILLAALIAVWIEPIFSMTVIAKKSRSGEINLSGIPSESSSGSSSKGGGLTQIPSEKTDFPGDDPSQVEVHVTSAKKDIIGDFHVRGDVKNLGNDTLQFVKVTVHFFDAANQPIGNTGCCYTDPTSIEPGHTSTFDSFTTKDEMSVKPSSFRISLDWQ